MAKSEGYVDAQYLKRTAGMLQHIKERTYALMQIAPGHHVLDLGCGPGVDTIPLARLVGERGRVIGVDIDEDMLAQADADAQASRVDRVVSHRRADVRALPFDAEAFDACRAERLFQVLPALVDAEAVLAEITRVTKSGGWIVAADADWASASLDTGSPVLERRLAQFFAEKMRPNGYAGRQLYRWFKRLGLAEVAVEVHPVPHTRLAHTHYGDWLHREAVAAGIMSDEEMTQWRLSLARADADGTFFSYGAMIVVAGRKGM